MHLKIKTLNASLCGAIWAVDGKVRKFEIEWRYLVGGRRLPSARPFAGPLRHAKREREREFEKETNFLKKSVPLPANGKFELRTRLCRTVAGTEAKFELQEVNSRNSNLRTRLFTE